MISELDTYVQETHDNNKKMWRTICDLASSQGGDITLETLRQAIRRGRRMPLLFILEYGGFAPYTLNVKDREGRSLLSEAMKCEIPKVTAVRILLRYGVVPTGNDLLCCESQKTIAKMYGRSPRLFKIIKALLLKRGCPQGRPYQTSFMGY